MSTQPFADCREARFGIGQTVGTTSLNLGIANERYGSPRICFQVGAVLAEFFFLFVAYREGSEREKYRVALRNRLNGLPLRSYRGRLNRFSSCIGESGNGWQLIRSRLC